MTWDEFEVTFAALTAAYPQREIATATQLIYWQTLQDIDGPLFAAAANRCLNGGDWFPTIRALRHAAEDIVMESIPDPYEAMKRFPHRIKNPAIRALLSTRPEEYDAESRHLQPENKRSDWIIGDPRRLDDGKPDA